jgi:Glycosyltransferase family 87
VEHASSATTATRGTVRRSERAVYALAALGFSSRLLLAWFSRGSNDAGIWEDFGWQISQFGLRSLYEHDTWFNHPPLMGGWGFLSFRIAEATRIPFPALLKLPGLLGDFGTGFLLWRIWRRRSGHAFGVPLRAWVVLLYAFNLDAILISGFHGNTDSLCAMFCLLAFLLQGEGRPLGAGLALAASLNVKLLPILSVPLLLLQQRTWRDASRFTLGLLVGLIPYLYLVPSAGIMLDRMNTYTSNLERWGLLAFLDLSVDLPRVGPAAAWAAQGYHAHGRYVLLAVFVGLGLVQRLWPRWTALELGALAFSGFLVFASGFGIQYTVYPVPFLCAVRLRSASAYGLSAGLFAGVLYLSYWTGTRPWYSLFTGPYPMPVPLLGVVAWVLLVQFFFGTLEQGMRRSAPPRDDGPTIR